MTHNVKRDEDDRTLFRQPAQEQDRPEMSSTVLSERSNNTLRAYREIRRRILEGEMDPGTQFLEQELAELLDMSRTPVREALIRLAEERLVEVRPRHGVRILPISADDIRDIYDMLIEIEAYAVRRIAERGLRNEDYVALTDAIVEMEASFKAANESYAEFEATSENFKTIWGSIKAFRKDHYLWNQVAELNFDAFLQAQQRAGTL